MRQTKYYQGYGYVTTGTGFFGNVFDFVTKAVTSKEAKDIALEAGKSFAKTAGTKAGDKLVDKIFKDKTPKLPINNTETPKLPLSNNTKLPSKDVLKKIYGDGLFKQSGKGLKRI